jgi:ribosomal protein S18 acetylase RimI-like enzyme
MQLLVNPLNTPAQGFYTRLGFSKIGEKPVRMAHWSFDDFLYSRPITNEQPCTN